MDFYLPYPLSCHYFPSLQEKTPYNSGKQGRAYPLFILICTPEYFRLSLLHAAFSAHHYKTTFESSTQLGITGAIKISEISYWWF